MEDLKSGTELLKISDRVYRNEKNRNIYIYCTKQELEDENFNSELRKLYKERLEKRSNEDIFIVVDGDVLEDPSCGGPLEKIDVGKYKGRYSKKSFMQIGDKMMAMKEPVSGTEVKLMSDGRYYSEALGKFFTLEKVEDGSIKFIPAFLPYSGMSDVPAKVEGDRLVGENGISFPIEKTGYVVTPSKQDLTTQEDIDKYIEQDRDATEKLLSSMKNELDTNLRARSIAWQREIAIVERNSIIDMAKMENRKLDESELPEIPEIPDDIPSDLMKKEIESVRKYIAGLNKIQEMANMTTFENAIASSSVFLGLDNLNDAIRQSVTGMDMLQAGRDLNVSTKKALISQEKAEEDKETKGRE